MKKSCIQIFSVLILSTLCSLAVTAEVNIEELLVRRGSASLNIRLTINNPSKVRQLGPVVAQLYARANSSEQWVLLRTWDNISTLGPGHRTSRDFFEENSFFLEKLADEDQFEVRAVVTGPEATKAAEKVSPYRTWFEDMTQ
ncbi:MAG: hypothetical protein WC314_05640 [Vulcanimicrobiota bacterium]